MEIIAVLTISVSILVLFAVGTYEAMNTENRFYSCDSEFIKK